MANQPGIGRKMTINKSGTVLAGLRSVETAYSGEPIDSSSGDDNGYRASLDEFGTEQIDISAEIIVKDETFRAFCLKPGTKKLTDIDIDYIIVDSLNTTPGNLSGDFLVTSYTETGTYQDAVTGSINLQSSGQWSYTDES